MPSGDQPCSSSPSNWREESFESVVLPVPDSPKKIAEPPSGFSAALAEQCIGITPRPGRM